MFNLMFPDDNGAGAATTKVEKPKSNKFVIGNIDVTKLTDEQLEQGAVLLIRGYSPEVYTKKGKQIELAKRLRREEIFDWTDLEKYSEKKRQESLADVNPEILALDKDTLIDLTERAGMRINWSLYDDANLWRVAKRLNNRIKKNEWTLDQVRTMQKPEGRTTRVPILFKDINNIPTTAPEGVDQWTIDLFNAIRNSPEFKDAEAQIGRSKGKRANAVLRFGGRNIIVGLPSDYALADEEEETPAETAAA